LAKNTMARSRQRETASERTCTRLTATVLLVGALLTHACSIEQPVSGPVALTSEWQTIEPPAPLRSGGRHGQYFCLHTGAAVYMEDARKNVVLLNGLPHVLEGEAVDDQHATYLLRPGMHAGDEICLSRAEPVPPGPDFPQARRVVALRLRSVPPIQVQEIRWLSFNDY